MTKATMFAIETRTTEIGARCKWLVSGRWTAYLI